MPGTADYNKLPRFDLTVNGTRLHYVDVGVGSSVVLVHGSPLSSFAFRHQIAALSSHFRVIAPDLPGFGQSEAIAEGPIFSRQSELLRGLLQRLDLGPIRLLGHDWGGPIGMGAVVDQLNHVKQLVLVNTTLRSCWFVCKLGYFRRSPVRIPNASDVSPTATAFWIASIAFVRSFSRLISR